MMDKNSIIFSMHHLDKFAIIDKPCTARIRVRSQIKWENLYEEDGHSRWIVNLKAITSENLANAKLMSKNINTISYYDMTKFFMTGALWESQVQTPQDLPIKGEEVGCVFDYVDGVLRCTNLSIIPRKRPPVYIHSLEVLEELSDLENLIANMKDE